MEVGEQCGDPLELTGGRGVIAVDQRRQSSVGRHTPHDHDGFRRRAVGSASSPTPRYTSGANRRLSETSSSHARRRALTVERSSNANCTGFLNL